MVMTMTIMIMTMVMVDSFFHLLIDQVRVVAVGEGGLHLDHLTSHLRKGGLVGEKKRTKQKVNDHYLFPDGVDVRILPLSSSLP